MGNIEEDENWKYLEKEQLRCFGIFDEIWSKYYEMIKGKEDKTVLKMKRKKCGEAWDLIQEVSEKIDQYKIDYLDRQ